MNSLILFDQVLNLQNSRKSFKNYFTVGFVKPTKDDEIPEAEIKMLTREKVGDLREEILSGKWRIDHVMLEKYPTVYLIDSNDLISNKNIEITYQKTPEVMKEVFEKIVQFCLKHESFTGESIMQSDEPQIELPDLLSEIIDDIIKFKVKYND